MKIERIQIPSTYSPMFRKRGPHEESTTLSADAVILDPDSDRQKEQQNKKESKETLVPYEQLAKERAETAPPPSGHLDIVA